MLVPTPMRDVIKSIRDKMGIRSGLLVPVP